MSETKKTFTIKAKNDIRTSLSCLGFDLNEKGLEIINNPFSEENGTCLYTMEQISQMFLEGTRSATIVLRKRPKNNPYNIIRRMDVHDILYFPFDKWNAVRSAACTLKRTFNCKYKVQKEGEYGKEAQIRIERLQ